jgi:hypothetical protein
VNFKRIDPRWSFLRIDGSTMLQVQAYYFYEFGRFMQAVVEWTTSPREMDDRALKSLSDAEYLLTDLIDPDNDVSFPQSSVPATKLRDMLRAVQRMKTADLGNKGEIQKAVLKFHHVYDAELGTKDFLLVEEIGIYSASALLNRAYRHLDVDVLLTLNKLAPSAHGDYAYAGRALALDLNTACGFHALRSVEAVARSYHMTVKQRDTVVENQPLSAIINELRDHMRSGAGNKEADVSLSLNVELLSRIDRIFRCPIMHPEMTLDKKRAKEVFDLSASVISAMVEDMKARLKAKAATP